MSTCSFVFCFDELLSFSVTRRSRIHINCAAVAECLIRSWLLLFNTEWGRPASLREVCRAANFKVTIKDKSFFLGFHLKSTAASLVLNANCRVQSLSVFHHSLSVLSLFFFVFLHVRDSSAARKKTKDFAALACSLLFEPPWTRSSSSLFAVSRSAGVSESAGFAVSAPHATLARLPTLILLFRTKRLCDLAAAWTPAACLVPSVFYRSAKECSISGFTLCADVDNTKKLNSSSEVRRPHTIPPTPPPPDRPGLARCVQRPAGRLSLDKLLNDYLPLLFTKELSL